MTFVLGLTGSIGMGKSATAAIFRRFGVPVHDADATVHRLYEGKAAPLIEAAFPGTAPAGVVDRAALSRQVIGSPESMARLEGIVHPLVRGEEERFLAEALAAHAPVAVLDIPLLFETGGRVPLRCGSRRDGRAGRAACARAGAARHERGDVRGHPREADAGCGEAQARPLSCGHGARLPFSRASGRRYPAGARESPRARLASHRIEHRSAKRHPDRRRQCAKTR